MSPSTTGSGFSLKDQLFNRDRVIYLSGLFQNADSKFDGKAFTRQCMRGLLDLELKQRIVHIAGVLETHLSDDFSTAATQIRKALPPPLNPERTDDDFGDFTRLEISWLSGQSKNRSVGLSTQTVKTSAGRHS